MKALMLIACMAVSYVAAAQDTLYDYQGAVMTGAGGPETITAQLDLMGPVSDLTFDVNVSIAGSYSEHFPENGCEVVCSSAGMPMTFQFNEKNGKFVGADLTMSNLYGTPPGDNVLFGSLSIGPKGDSLKFTDLDFGTSPISVSNSTPGIWTEMRAPELNVGGALSAMTLLVMCILMLTQRRKSSSGLVSARILPESLSTYWVAATNHTLQGPPEKRSASQS